MIRTRINTKDGTNRFAYALTAILLFISGFAQLLQSQTELPIASAAHDTWSTGTPLPIALEGPATGAIGGQIYVVGGWNGTTVLPNNQVYNPATNTWSTSEPMPLATYSAASAVYKNILFIFGGSTSGTNVVSKVWAYDPAKDLWVARLAMNTARAQARAVVENGIIYVIGGVDSVDGDRLTTVEAYNPVSNSWTEEAPLLEGKSGSTVGLLGSTITAADGDTSSGDTGDNEEYAASTNLWSALASDPTGRDLACGGSINGKLYVAGGHVVGETPALTVNESFDISTNSWTTLAPLPQPAKSAGFAVYAGHLFCFGGNSSEGGPVIDNVQIYEP
jgi:N-acetylneuraminic acid mutarotase